jgi:hypothetical protein
MHAVGAAVMVVAFPPYAPPLHTTPLITHLLLYTSRSLEIHITLSYYIAA